MVARIDQAGISTLGQVLTALVAWSLPTSHDDADLSDLACVYYGVATPLAGSSTPAPSGTLSLMDSDSPASPTRGPSCFVPHCDSCAAWLVTGDRAGRSKTVAACLEHLVGALRAGVVRQVISIDSHA